MSLLTPVLWYKFNGSETLGTDSSGSSLDITTNVGVTLKTDDPTYGKVAEFDGSSSLVLANASIPAAMQGTSARSYSFWFKDTGSVSAGVIHSIGNASGTGARFRTSVVGGIHTAFNNLSALSTSTVTINTWYHVVTLFNGTTYKSYIDAALENNNARAINTNASTDFGIGIDPTGGSALQMTGYLLDFRVYDYEILQADVTTLFTDGPEIGVFLTATMYTHIADLTWDAVSGASTYTLTQTEDAGTEETILENSTGFSHVSLDLNPGSSYLFNIYTDIDMVTPTLQLTESALVVDTANVTAILLFISNDLTVLSGDSVLEIDGELRNSLTTGDIVETELGETVFVGDSFELTVPNGVTTNVLTPFQSIGDNGQTIDITTPDETVTITYNDGTGQVIYDGVSYALGEYFVVGSYKVRVENI